MTYVVLFGVLFIIFIIGMWREFDKLSDEEAYEHRGKLWGWWR